MQKNKNHNYFDNIGSVINGLVKHLSLEKGLKTGSISKLWPKIIGPRFEKTSKIFSIQSNNEFDVVIVAVSSASVLQELIFYKDDILRKVYKIGMNFGFNIKDIKFSTKFWKQEKKLKAQENITFSEHDLEKIEIPENILISLKNSLREKDLFNEEIKEKFLHTMIKDLKIQIWKKNNGFPACLNCGITLSLNIAENKNFCPSCKYNSQH